MKFLLTLTIISVVCGLIFADECEDFRIIDSIHPEAPCSRTGGLCVIAADCPQGLLVEERGLCPEQQNRGVECCSGISVKETRCRKHGGECMEDCKEGPKYKKATDCPATTVCCILV